MNKRTLKKKQKVYLQNLALSAATGYVYQSRQEYLDELLDLYLHIKVFGPHPTSRRGLKHIKRALRRRKLWNNERKRPSSIFPQYI